MAKKGALTGLLLFGIFFGAGNLIFPPSLGALSGEHFLPAIAGFVFSGVGIAVLTLIIGTLNPKGYIYEISTKIAPWFATLYLSVLYLSIGPFFFSNLAPLLTQTKDFWPSRFDFAARGELVENRLASNSGNVLLVLSPCH